MIFRKEKEVIKSIYLFIDEIEKCVQLAEDTIQTYIKGEVDRAKKMAREVRLIESEADVIRYAIRDKLYSGAYLPLIREDIYRLLESLDKVANAAEAACDFFLNQRPLVPDEMKTMFSRVAHNALDVVKPLKKAVRGYLKADNSTAEIWENAKKVGLQESTVDKIEWDLTKMIFTSHLEYCHKIHLRLGLEAIVEVSDRAEDAADQLKLVTLKTVL